VLDHEQVNRRVREVEQLLQAKLGVRGGSLSTRLSRAGRRLPRRIQKAGQVIIDAQAKAAHPKLARMLDAPMVDRAFADITEHLKTIDPADRRKGAILGLLGGLVFNLLVLAVIVVVLMRWRGVL